MNPFEPKGDGWDEFRAGLQDFAKTIWDDGQAAGWHDCSALHDTDLVMPGLPLLTENPYQ